MGIYLLFYKSLGSQCYRLHTVWWALRDEQLFSFHCTESVMGPGQESFRMKWNLISCLGNLLPGILGRDQYGSCQTERGM